MYLSLRQLSNAFLALGVLITSCKATSFNPRGYQASLATCKAVNRISGKEVDITLKYVDINPDAKPTILMLHGWPSLWSSWSYQIQEFQNDYHLIAMDLRGFGESTSPGDVQSSNNLADIASDLACVLEHAKVDSAICLGHDWGAEVCYEAARRRPDIFEGVVGITVPYLHSAGPFVDNTQLMQTMPRLAYQIFFENHTTEAISELNKDIRRSLRATLRTVASPPPDNFLTNTTSYMGAWSTLDEIPPIPFFTPEEEDYLVEQFSIQKFDNTLIFYTHGDRYGTWKAAQEQGNFSIPQPALSILPLNDPVADWVFAAKYLKSASFLPQLTTKTMSGAHWPHLENPDAFNSILRDWLNKNTKKSGPTLFTQAADEL
ncbi:hypothetical protein SERLA73DRAFT_103194 [Serpula lacrymans var. lacrymans S7.3]|uniref:AB hydrolase-1 domain-containing protein n=2 Tax=Serpula lacrymans var. lacrymans TaxID=341189 RepID=F8PPJ6_SERL3|nr:uncharacterized protein SERLADRAFT_354546 [Serpula lacrymans var. lacrymans S7.9]EGO01415.1 hypothetical protein SERLA73DRAFT_103194 [Serpula lacrymans var. lacrymans S7.3]EGO27047.1 hypothetical protein SERLADRAFT_354546 [Serpula lacrymans var. lacrymans S7.9]